MCWLKLARFVTVQMSIRYFFNFHMCYLVCYTCSLYWCPFVTFVGTLYREQRNISTVDNVSVEL
jgi:hypothetical protein